MLIRRYEDRDAATVRALFVRINRALATDALRRSFESYIAQSLEEEIDRIPAYYAARGGSFWIADDAGTLLGMFGLERIDSETAELRRMYVAPEAQRRGIARQMLAHAERTCREAGLRRLVLSTSELQQAALTLYRAAGFRLVREEVVEARTNKTVGAGLRRFYFEKTLGARHSSDASGAPDSEAASLE